MEKSDLEKAFRARADILMTGAVNLANDAIKTAGLISGGASVAALGFLSQRSTDPIGKTVAATLPFFWGALLASGLAACAAYAAQYFHARAADSRAADPHKQNKRTQAEAAGREHAALWFHWGALGLVALCYVAMAVGFFRLANAIK